LAGALWPDALSAAVALPDARRGERIVLVTQDAQATRADFAAYAKGQGASDLAVPSEVAIVESVPLLGTGKVDFPGLKQLVETLEAQKVSAA
jgi:acyl-[acyl-carrier-protein]-phospholipid O-acyltransferase/long-chain-fatty-acid--[acyl-carrier-protein] ligase